MLHAIVSPVPPTRRAQRIVHVVVGTAMVGFGQALMVRSKLGLAPWEVLAQGVAKHAGVLIGTAGIGIALGVLILWIPLRQRLGVGTLVNPVIAGLTVNQVLGWLGDASTGIERVGFLLVGVVLVGVGIGIYLSAGLGAGPRDGLMTGLVARGHSLRVIRTVLELSVLLLGFVLGGTIGIGTVLFALTVGPIVHTVLNKSFVFIERTSKTKR